MVLRMPDVKSGIVHREIDLDSQYWEYALGCYYLWFHVIVSV